MNRRSLFSKLLGGLLGASVQSTPQIHFKDNFAKSLKMSTQTLKAGTLAKLSIPMSQESVDRAVRNALTNVKFYLPDGSFSVVPGLTIKDDCDTIWNAPSSG